MSKPSTKILKDSMGEMKVPTHVLYGASTQRAVDNFPISGRGLPAEMIHILGLIKVKAAETNARLGHLDKGVARAVAAAAWEVYQGRWDGEFVVDLYQTGSGTSTNMNANEVIAHRAVQLKRGSAISPNDHVNFGQSSNDVIPTMIHITVAEHLVERLLPALAVLRTELTHKARQFDKIVKTGRTHLQDATPIRVGQVFSGYAHQIQLAIERFKSLQPRLCELPLGGTAVGTGINTDPRFARLTIAALSKELGIRFTEARNHFQAQACPDSLMELAAQLKVLAVALNRIGRDIRFLACGPHAGIGELQVPAVQPGSSIMPAKVNPVIIESLIQVCARVIGNETTVTMAMMESNCELNTAYPVMGDALFQSVDLLATKIYNFAAKCLKGITVNVTRCRDLLDRNYALGTALNPIMGYQIVAAVIKEASAKHMSLRDAFLKTGRISKAELDRHLNPWPMTKPGV
jgi:fumarate hydratase class II